MKKINFLKLLLICVFCISAVFAFVACGDCKHEYGDWKTISQATCLTEGSEERSCKNCSEKETRTISVLLHEKGNKLAYDKDSHWYLCKNGCDKKYEIETHMMDGQWQAEKLSTCLIEGEEFQKCVTCDQKQTRQMALAQCEKSDQIAFDKDSHWYKCKYNCNTKFEQVEHQGDWNTTVEPTCLTLGEQERICTVCSSKQTMSVQKLQHTASSQSVQTLLKHGYLCSSGCGEMFDGQIHHYNINNICIDCDYALPYTTGLDINDGRLEGIGTATDKDIVIPAYHNGQAVTSIRAGSFSYSDITSVVVPETVVLIKGPVGLTPGAFEECRQLKTVYISSSVDTIEIGAFIYNTAIEKFEVSVDNQFYSSMEGTAYAGSLYTKDKKTLQVVGNANKPYIMPDSITYVCSFAAYGFSIPSIQFSKNLKTIGRDAFAYNDFDEVIFYDGLISIDADAFYSCENLTKVIMPDTVTYVGRGCFGWCTELTDVKFSNNLTVLTYGSFVGCNIQNAKLPENLIIMEDNSLGLDMQAYEGIEKLILPSKLERMGEFAISGYMYEIYIPSTVVQIAETALCGSCSVRTIDLAPNNPAYKLIDGHLFTKDGTVLMKYAGNNNVAKYVVPQGVKRIANDAFSRSQLIEEIVLSNSVEEIGEGAFRFCFSLKKINIPQGIKVLLMDTFTRCDALEEVVIDEGVQKIEQVAFELVVNA